MLGIKLSASAEERLTWHARDSGRPKSVIARDWIMERLDREEIDDLIRHAAAVHAGAGRAASDLCAEYLRLLNEADGGYDWGPDGPPQPV